MLKQGESKAQEPRRDYLDAGWGGGPGFLAARCGQTAGRGFSIIAEAAPQPERQKANGDDEDLAVHEDLQPFEGGIHETTIWWPYLAGRGGGETRGVAGLPGDTVANPAIAPNIQISARMMNEPTLPSIASDGRA